MKLIEHYLRLRIAHPMISENVSFDTKIADLAKILCCTERNVKILLARMEKENWISWEAGRGRGNRSKLTFHLPFAESAVSYFTDLLAKGHITDAFQFMNSEGIPAPIREALQTSIHSRFGFQVEQDSELMQDVLRIPLRRKLSTLDPALVSLVMECHLVRQMYDTLVNFNTKTKRIEPHLAHAWETNNDYTRWVIYLRKGVKFHHGRRLTVKDVVHTFQRLMDPRKSIVSWLDRFIDFMESKNEHTIVFHLRQSTPFFLHFLCSINTSILPHDVSDPQKAVGTGPFMLRSFTKDMLVLEAFEDYFKERALLDRVEIWFVPEEIFAKSSSYLLPYMLSENEMQEKQINQAETCIMMFNFMKPGPHHDVLLRKALCLALDRTDLIQSLKGTRLAPASSFLPHKSLACEVPKKSLAEAKSMLEKSSYQGETLKLYFVNRHDHHQDALWIYDRAKEIGLNLQLVPFPLEKFYDGLPEQEADLIMLVEVMDKDIEMSLFMLFENTFLLRRYLHPLYRAFIDQQMDQFAKEPSVKKRELVWDQVERFLHEECILLFLYHQAKHVNYPRALQGIRFDSFGWADFRKLWVKPVIEIDW